MATVAEKRMVRTAGEALLPDGRIDYDRLITRDDEPVESMYAEKQMRLLTAPLYAAWSGPGEGRPFFASANVGLFYTYREPPVVPDMMFGLDVALDPQFRSYFVWEYGGKAPDAIVEIVSGKRGGELGKKKRLYQKLGIPYYVVWDPEFHLSDQALTCFILRGRKFEVNGDSFPEIGLGVRVWHGVFESLEGDWLRWCDEKGTLIPTPEEMVRTATQRANLEKQLAKQERQRTKKEKQRAEVGEQRAEQEKQRAEQEKQRAEQEKQRAEQEKQRADDERLRAEKLAEKLRALGVDPDQP